MSFVKKFILLCNFYFVFVIVTFLLTHYTKDYHSPGNNIRRNFGPTNIGNRRDSFISIILCDNYIKYFPVCQKTQSNSSTPLEASLVLYLLLNDSNIQHVNEDTFSLYKNVQVINLSKNLLKDLPAYVFRNQINLKRLFLTNNALIELERNVFYGLSNLERLYLDFNKLESISGDFQVLTSVKYISLSHNELTLEKEIFPAMPSLRELYLDYNRMKRIPKDLLRNLEKLLILSLSNNQIETIDPRAFEPLKELWALNLYNNSVTRLASSTFFSQRQLIGLNLGHNPLESLSHETFKNLSELRYLNLEGIEITNINTCMFDSLKKLTSVAFERYSYCHYISKEMINCSPSSDGISSANNLLFKQIFRFWNWLISLTICVGNLLVIFSRLLFKDENKMLSLVIRNLAVSDFLMGIYLIIIGIYDVKFRNIYNEKAQQWLSSWTCTFTGIIGMVSSEVTVCILVFISVDRYLTIVSTYGKYRTLTLRDTTIILAVIWALGITVAVFPVIRYGGVTRFYGINGLCFPLHIAKPYYTGWQYSALIVFGINATSLIIIALVYTGIFISIRRTREATPLPQRVYEFVVRFFFIVFIYALCWLPIILFKIAAYAGAEISDEFYGWLVVFILPVNSASNPILYTFTTPKYRNKMRIFYIFGKVKKKMVSEGPSFSVPSEECSGVTDDSKRF